MRMALAVLVVGVVVVAPASFLTRPAAPRPVEVARTATQVDNAHHLYVLDGHGDVYPVGDAPPLKPSVTWPNKDVAYSLALFADGTGGYVLNAWGGVDPVGDAPPVQTGLGGMGFGVARQVVMAPWASRAEPAGYVLDGYGGLHVFGGAPPVLDAAYFKDDVARGVALLATSTRELVAGYMLDGNGGVHPFGGAPAVVGGAAAPHWSGDVARGLVLAPGGGYVLDQAGGLHPFGSAPGIDAPAMWPGQDVADSVVAWSLAPAASPGGWILDRHGGVHAYGSAPALDTGGHYWPAWDIARGLGGAGASDGGSRERRLVDPEILADGWGAYYNQRDSRWGTDLVGASQWPVWEIGCLLTDVAMVYTHFGHRGVTPASLAANVASFYLDGEITNAALDVPGHPAVINRRPSPDWISAQVAAGRPVIVGMNLPGGGTHFVVLTGLDGSSDFWANDPWDQNGMGVQFSGDWDDRGAIYEAIAYP